jgi:predicted DNA-binding transcriptional regulator AlpA
MEQTMTTTDVSEESLPGMDAISPMEEAERQTFDTMAARLGASRELIERFRPKFLAGQQKGQPSLSPRAAFLATVGAVIVASPTARSTPEHTEPSKGRIVDGTGGQESATEGKTEGDYVSVPEAARRLGMSEKWAWKHVADRRIPGILKLGRSVRLHWPTLQRRTLSGQLLLDNKYALGDRKR